VLPTLDFISRVFESVHATINTWCQPSRMGAAVTVLRNMAIASWYQVGCPARNTAACTLLRMPQFVSAANVAVCTLVLLLLKFAVAASCFQISGSLSCTTSRLP
jgi:hypothetical protein